MYLKSLTLKGFKSFASATTLRFEPGICAIVGPNGSGKSNVLDALTWVMGEQGAKTLRGGKMEDVIFAGTPTKAALGRAEVTLTIDNSDGALPIDYSEVSITRRMFRDGASEYEINGDRVRLMDVQELLSDSGIGREMHVIVGQGKLAEILESRPEERRAFIEEAAGVLKHRRRKEKALRKLSAMQVNFDRVSDLTKELRRQLKPLGRQAEAARRAQVIQADARDARLRIAADDLVQRRAEASQHEQLQRDMAARRQQAEAYLSEMSMAVEAAETELAALTPALDSAQQNWFALSALSERVAATLRIAEDRARHLRTEIEPHFGPDPAQLEKRAEEAAREEAEIVAALRTATAALTAATKARADAEKYAEAVEKKRLAVMRAVADRREGIARLAGTIQTTRNAISSTESQAARYAEELETARQQLTSLQQEAAAAESRLQTLENSEQHLNERFDQATAERDRAEERCTALRNDERSAEKEAAGLHARIDALALTLGAGDAAAWLEKNADHVGLSGKVAQKLTVTPGWEAAIAVALGEAASAYTVSSSTRAQEAVAALRAGSAGRSMFLIESRDVDDFRMDVTLPAGAQWALDVVSVPLSLQSALTSLLMDAVLVEDMEMAEKVIRRDRRLRVVTRSGDARGWGWATGGTRKAHSDVEINAAIEDAQRAEKAALAWVEKAQAAFRGAEEEYRDRTQAAAQAYSALVESDSAIATLTKELARLTASVRSASLQQDRLIEQRNQLEEQQRGLLVELTELEERQRLATEEPEEPTLFDDTVATEAASAVAHTRATEMEARLAVRTAEERSSHVRGRADALHRQAARERELRERAERRAATRGRALDIIAAVQEAGQELQNALQQQLSLMEERRQVLASQQSAVSERLSVTRQRRHEASVDFDKLRESAHQDEVLRAQAQERLHLMEQQVLEDLGMAVDDLIEEYGPDVLLPPSPVEMQEYEDAKERGEQVSRPQPLPYDREQQQRRLQAAERDLARLGKVNPLALEEFAALQERYTFLSTQLEDIKKARKDLLEVVEDVDERIQTVFEEAFQDVAREFVTVFSTLFPGGEGRLYLTDPEDMLNTGVEVEARPPGKKVKRLSLLSGGEKSLTAIAMLVAIFKARPSPFYILDEVEAALDDTNLHRLLGLFRELKERSQLLVITHQKLTMDLADVLYGVTMKGDGITRVISQRMHPATPLLAAASPQGNS
ncbi:MAG: chromosome segregation protein SMC [Corynebacteriales bacterium]|uniref:chromosome segregation protein SMC n=1 Tax=uncultured Lawsonella sp. TaxID=1847727 RepID=UPI00256E9342|nr:chromosome segregation protein SMC [uncultured Lawsonella sp.]MBS6414915.1 chromosome segregation protein SMC [Mycobacteriales bacterium]